jgi:NitT/TauT family transport system substrate-binding protein
VTRPIVVLLCALLACAGALRPAVADDNLTLVAGAIGPNIFDTLDLVAKGAGFFKQEHINLDKEYTGSAFTATQLVATGKADILASSIEPILLGYAKGIRLQIFFTRSPRFSYVLGVLDSSPIHTIADFKGTTIGVMNIDSAGALVGRSILAGAGLKSSDYDYVPIGTGAQGLEALVDKRVAGAAFPYVELALYQVEGPVSMRIYRHPILKDVANVAFEASPATIAAKADALRRFTRAIAEAAIFVRENPQVAARYFLQGAGLKVTDEALKNQAATIALCQPDLAGVDPTNKRIGYVFPQSIDLYSHFLTDAGMQPQFVPASAVVDDQFVAYANDFDHEAIVRLAKAAR